MPATYGWIIDTDHLADPGTNDNAAGTMGPRDIAPEVATELRKKRSAVARTFRIFDDDGELYYTGRYIGPDDERAIGPLDDFGSPNAGAVSIHYRRDGRWEAL